MPAPPAASRRIVIIFLKQAEYSSFNFKFFIFFFVFNARIKQRRLWRDLRFSVGDGFAAALRAVKGASGASF